MVLSQHIDLDVSLRSYITYVKAPMRAKEYQCCFNSRILGEELDQLNWFKPHPMYSAGAFSEAVVLLLLIQCLLFLHVSNLQRSYTYVSIQHWRSQNAERITHTKGRLLDPAVIHFNRVPFQNGNFSKRKEFAPRGSKFFPLTAVPYVMKITFTILGDFPWMLL